MTGSLAMAPKIFNCFVIGYRASSKHILNGLLKLWIKILFITLIFALVQTSTPSSSIQQQSIQKRGDFLVPFYFEYTSSFFPSSTTFSSSNNKNKIECFYSFLILSILLSHDFLFMRVYSVCHICANVLFA